MCFFLYESYLRREAYMRRHQVSWIDFVIIYLVEGLEVD